MTREMKCFFCDTSGPWLKFLVPIETLSFPARRQDPCASRHVCDECQKAGLVRQIDRVREESMQERMHRILDRVRRKRREG